MAVQINKKRTTSYTGALVKTKVKMGGRTVVSKALVKPSATNHVPKMHVKNGDLVIVISGNKERKVKTGKVMRVLPKTGQVIVEGINIITSAVKSRNPMVKSGLIKKEGPIYASKVMLYDTDKKKAVRAEQRKNLG
jgi:large subunit ribosomal protein L24